MKQKNLIKHTFWAACILSIFLVSMTLLSFQQSAYAQAEKEEKYRITLKSRTITPKKGINLKFQDHLMTRLKRGEKTHVLLQLEKNLNKEEREKLEKQGIKLLHYIGSYTWYAVVTSQPALEFTVAAKVKQTPILGKIRWLGEIRKEDRINPILLTKGFAPHSRVKGATVCMVVSFHKDVDLSKARTLVEQSGGKVLGEVKILNTLQISGSVKIIKKLIVLDAVKWVDQLPPKGEDDNDELRTTINADDVTVDPYFLDGTGVTVGQWESGNVKSHDAFTGRLDIGDSSPVYTSDHATHVCGTILGDGTGSATHRGIADNASCISFRRHETAEGSLDVAEMQPQYTTAIGAPYNIVLSNNSWGTDHYHTSTVDYDVGMEFYDQVIRGELGRPISIIASAGNQGSDWGTLRIPNSAKNTIEVGACYSDTDYFRVTCFSSRGPTGDSPFTNERLKPDIVAPGDEASDDLSDVCLHGDMIRSTIGDATSYGEGAGTSMSTPAVSGVVALMIHQYRSTYFGGTDNTEVPLPSTIKAILCHTADDLTEDPDENPDVDFTGPDYFSGYGRVNAQAAVDAIRDKRFREGVILSEGGEDIYTFVVAIGTDELKATLAWDDVAANPGDTPGNILKNDLDLILINPDGDEYYPPWELDPTNPATPATRSGYATEALADGHADHVNVVEQVVVDNPMDGTWKIKVKASELPEPYQRYSIIAGDEEEHQLEGNVDIVQVLDRSGSMGGLASSDSLDTKIEVLKDAADEFIQMMKPDEENQLGLVQFNHDVFDFTTSEPYLQPLTTDPDTVTLMKDAVESIEHGGATSIGDGLDKALEYFTTYGTAGNDPVILLVTDGKENSSLWIDDVDDDLISNGIAVYPLGLGYDSGIDEAKLTDLAEATGGTYRITSDPMIFCKFFIEVLAGAVDWSVVLDPIGELSPGETTAIPVPVTANDIMVTFSAIWEGVDNAIKLTLVSPSGVEVSGTGNGIRYVEHPRYAFYQLDFPLKGKLASEWTGVWKMKLESTGGDTKIRYSASAYSQTDIKLDARFDKLSHLTGDKVLVTAKLTRGGQPLHLCKFKVFCNVPNVGIGNLLYKSKIRKDQLKPDHTVDGDKVSMITQKLQLMEKEAGKDIFERGWAELQLYDDGEHNDGKANDGTYANTFNDTKIPGSYTFRFVASDIPAKNGQQTTREWTKSFYNEVNIDAEYSVVDVDLTHLTRGDKGLYYNYNVKIAPRDKFGNYLGPGRQVIVNIVYPDGSKTHVPLQDNINGTYTKEICISKADVDSGAKLEIDVNGKTFTIVEKLPTFRKWSFSIHSGYTFPIGNFGNLYNGSYMFGFDLDYHFTPQWSLVGSLGYNHFRTASPTTADTHWWNISANLKFEFNVNPFRPYVKGGFGIYIPKTGNSKPGVNVGLGWDFSFNANLIFEIGADYHRIFTGGTGTSFFTAHTGLVLRF